AAVPLDPKDLYNPINRRISIIVMKRGEAETTPGLMPVPGISAVPVPEAPAMSPAAVHPVPSAVTGTPADAAHTAAVPTTATQAGRNRVTSVVPATPSAAVPVPPAGPAVHAKPVMAEARS
ncbi:MAG TPA: motility protein MotB, partial [Burkholderiaceae bacterium]|nr:motility protein MotB [Burkholderiaceae bacterium]